MNNNTMNPHQPEADFSEDFLLGGRVFIRQPRQGYRVAIDPIFLAASIQAEPGETVLDIGAGVGAASICLAMRIPNIKVIGVELQRDYVRFAADNILANKLRDRVEILRGDLLRPPPRLAAGTFSHVMTNPPYLEVSRNNISPHDNKATSNTEGEADLDQWARFCLLMVRPKGSVTFIHRSDRLDQILSFFSGKLGNIRIYPLWPGKNKPAKRVLIRGTKNTHGALRLCPGMILHAEDGSYTAEAEAILRQGQGVMI
ncbi:MAG: methyltransferase [Alphaproteobacteria bacterium]|nr:methyltransferase [Alphaproteobacteria bacterium]